MTHPQEPGAPDPQQPGGYEQPPSYGGVPPQGQPQYGAPQAPQYGQPPQYGAPQYGGQQPYGQPGPGRAGGPLAPQEERFWGSAAHWGALVAGFVTSGFLAFLVPLLVMMIKGNDSPFVRRQAVESLNFQISLLIYAAVSVVLLFVLIGFVLLPIVAVWWIVGTILGAVKANNGEENRFKLIFRFVS